MRRSLSSFLAVGLLALPSTEAAFAQTGVLSGVVTGATTLEPLASAQVQILGGATGTGALTDTDGTFRFALGPGTYSVVVQYIGYVTKRVDGVSVGEAETELAIVLESTALSLNELVVTVSRTLEPQKRTAAPAHTEVIDEIEIQERPATTPVGHLKATTGVDIMTHGVQANNIVVRGFNNIFSGALHALTDNRIAGVPSLRVNLLHFVPAVDDDIDRIEVVLGPGSALYGPNTANGVLHIITKSPLDEQGTTISVAGGERNLFKGMFRTAQLLSDDFGIKFSGQYLRVTEWRYTDPTEAALRALIACCREDVETQLIAQGTPPSEVDARIARMGVRDFATQRWGGELRADWRLNEDASLVLQAGMTNSDGIELTGLGAGQTDDWRYLFAQSRFNWGKFFAQAYVNASDAGDVFLIRRGAPIEDNSKLVVGQLQHGISLGETMDDGGRRQDFTYGVDYFLTQPNSNGTIHGQYEEDAEIKEIGAYIQSQTALSDRLDVVLAARVDDSSVLDERVFSPRAGLVFEPEEDQALRVTFNRAFSTPTTLNMFLDINGGFAQGLEDLGFLLRAQGPGRSGLSFQNSGGGFVMRSPFTPAELGGPGQLLPPDPNILWQYALGVAAQLGLINPQQAAALATLDASSVGLNLLDPVTQSVTPAAGATIPQTPALKESITTTFEVGYQGVLGGRVALAADLWVSSRENFTSPLLPRTPLVLLDGQDIGAMLAPLVQAGLMTPGEAATLAAGAASVPLAVVSSDQVQTTSADLVASYVNLPEQVDLWGWDVSLQAFLDQRNRWTLKGSASWVSDDYFELQNTTLGLSAAQSIVGLNAPDFKAALGLAYRDPGSGFNAEVRVRHRSEFPVNSADFVGLGCIEGFSVSATIRDCVESATLADLVFGYHVPRTTARLQLSVDNVFDTGYRSFVGVPEIGRFAMAQLKYAF